MSRIRILILDSNPADVDLIKEELRRSGIEIIEECVQTKDEYLQKLIEFAPDIILSENDPAKFNGTEALKIARERCPETPFIIVSKEARTEKIIDILTGGATGYVMKSRLSRLAPAVMRAVKETEDRNQRRTAEAERNVLCQQLQQRTAELAAEIEERKRAEKRYRKIFEKADEGIFQSTVDGRYLNVNPAFARIHGFASPREMIESITDIGKQIYVNPGDRERLVRMLLEHDKAEGFEIEAYRKDRTKCFMSVNIHTVRDGSGNIKFFEGTTVDISDYKLRGEALRESEECLKAALSGAEAGMWVWDLKSEWRTTPQMKVLFGRCADDPPMDFGEFSSQIHPADLERIRKAWNRTVQCGNPFDQEYRILWPDGTVHWLASRGRMVEFASGTRKFLGISFDITGRKRAEEDVKASLQRLRALVSNMQSAILLVGDDRIELANKAFCDYFELRESPAELIGLTPAEMIEKIKNAYFKADEEVARIQEIVRMGQQVVGEEILMRNGRSCLRDFIPIFVNGKSYGRLWYHTDITERKSSEEALRRTKDELEHRVRERTAQLAEINKTLVVEIEERKQSEMKLLAARKNLRALSSEIIISEERARQHFANDLHDTVVQTLGAAKLRSQLIQDQIQRKAKPLFNEMQDMISQSIAQARQIMAEMSPPVLNELGLVPALEWLAETIGSQHGIFISFECRQKPEPLPREIDVLLYQTTRELLMNIVKHAEAENAKVTFSNTGPNLSIEVIDDGKGFDVKDTFKPDSKGGYGLYSVRERLHHIGGQLAIKSKPGQGTTVLIIAPLGTEK